MQSKPLRGAASDGRQPGLLGAVLSGLFSRPAVRDELGELPQRPAALDLVDHVDQVRVGVEAEDQTAVDEREGRSQPLAPVHRAGEQEHAACEGDGPNPSGGSAVVDLETTVIETALEVRGAGGRRRSPGRRHSEPRFRTEVHGRRGACSLLSPVARTRTAAAALDCLRPSGQTQGNKQMRRQDTQLFGITIHSLDMQGAVARVLALASDQGAPRCRYVVTPNLNHIVMLSQREDLHAAYSDAALVVADGSPLLWTARALGHPLPCRIAGSDLVPAIFEAVSASAPLTTFFLGAAPGVAERAKLNVERRWPHVRVVGTHSPPMGFEYDPRENGRALELVAQARPDLLLVGLGAPKQELWVHRHQDQLCAAVALCVGATIDFLAGEKSRAPRWMRKLALEWLYRVAQEPKRLAPRYFWDGVRFPRILYREVRSRWGGR
jgi:N-acetylglucosaminyldiphosphoundecaprenol N-acetyl-beta-D-mannosaminyltransferase